MRLELENVSMAYQSGTPFSMMALEDVSLVVEPGERLAIAGPVGSGKSTLLAILAGVETPTKGRVIHDTREIVRRQPPPPGSIGLAFQSPENCLFDKTVHSDVSFAPRRQGLDGPEVERRVEKALAAVGIDLASMGQRSPFSLSIGEQRRVALAGLLAMEPRALLLDEPTAYLDPAARRDLMARLVELNEETGVTMVMVGHDMDELARFAGRLIIIDGGRKVSDGRAETILTDSALLAEHSLDPPGTVELCSLLSAVSGDHVAPTLSEEQAIETLMGIMKGGCQPSCR